MSPEWETLDDKILQFRAKKDTEAVPEVVRRQFEILSGALSLQRNFEKVSWDYWLSFEKNNEYKKAKAKALNRLELEALIKYTIFNSFLLLRKFGYADEALALIIQEEEK